MSMNQITGSSKTVGAESQVQKLLSSVVLATFVLGTVLGSQIATATFASAYESSDDGEGCNDKGEPEAFSFGEPSERGSDRPITPFQPGDCQLHNILFGKPICRSPRG